jgi:hypothetical protein
MMRLTLKDMTEIERLRFLCVQGRRIAHRALQHAKRVDVEKMGPEDRATLADNIAFAQTCIKLTEPAWVAKASPEELLSVLRHLSGNNTQ